MEPIVQKPKKVTQGATVLLIQLAASLLIYVISLFLADRYGYAALVLFVQKTGIPLRTPYAAAFLQLLGVFFVMLIVFLVIRRWYPVSEGKGSFGYGVFVGGYMLFYSLFSFAMTLPGISGFQDSYTILFSVLYFTLVGIMEELVFRGIAADLLLRLMAQILPKKKPVIPAVILSGILFALAHASNLQTAAYTGVLIQMTGAFIMGMFLTAVYYRSANLSAVMFLHVINDLAAAFPVTILQSEESVVDVISGYRLADLVLLIPYIAVTVFILRAKTNRCNM